MYGRLVGLILLLCLLFCDSTCDEKNKRFYKKYEFEVPLDHFSFATNKTFKIHYLLNDTYWNREDGPIFFYTGNEGAIELFAEFAGFIWEIAREFKALVVFAEHRYYGESLPFGNKSFTSPEFSGYLTSTQALADYADLITYIQNENRKSLNDKYKRNNPVIAFGGSYGGMLAAYIRMKYPAIVTGAIAASAPILQFKGMIPCDSFFVVTTSSFKAVNSNCSDNIRKSWAVIRSLASNADGRAWLSKEWKLCKEIKADGDTQMLLNYLSSVYTTLAMVNYPYECDFIAPLPANPVREFCYHLSNGSLNGKPLLKALFSALNVYSNFTENTKCIDTSDSTTNPALGDLGWAFQSCTEMVMPMCSTGKSDMFENIPWNEKSFTESCKKLWGVTPSYNLAEKEFGGNHLQDASNIVFSNGLLDPWASGGVFKNYSNSVYAVLIPEGAHHLDLMGANPKDPYSVRVARNLHKYCIKQWIKSSNREH